MRICCEPSLSSISILLPPPVWMMFIVEFAEVTGLGFSAFGATPAMAGRSGSPPSKTHTTSVPARRGKWKLSGLPPCGWSMRTRLEAFPFARELSSNWNFSA